MVVNDDGWLADVGFGDSLLEPIPLVPGQVREQSGCSYKLDNQEGDFHLMRLDEHGQWQAQYRFTLKERYLRDFEPMSTYHQRSPESSFTQRCIVTIAIDVGRITLADFRLITSREGTKEERSIVDTSDFASVLTRHFGIELPDADLSRLTIRCPARNAGSSSADPVGWAIC
jgi:N-hydroxyarylamine O-acetyltransferase